jgi:hypothetical protein
MISKLQELPAGVIGFEATGKIAAEDYRDVVVPALQQAAKSGDVRFLIIMRDFDGITGGALWRTSTSASSTSTPRNELRSSPRSTG